MSALLVILLLTVVFMAAQDTAGTGMVVAQSRNVGRLAGVLDAARDFASRYGTAITAAAVVRWGLYSWQVLLVTALSAATSYFTTSEVTTAVHELLDRDPRRMHRWLRALISPSVPDPKGKP